jgi:hypothetical protein
VIEGIKELDSPMLMIQVEHYLQSAVNDNAELADRYDRYVYL